MEKGKEIVKVKLPTIADLENVENHEKNLKNNKLMVLVNQPAPVKFIKENNGIKYLPIEVQKYFLTSIYGGYQIEIRKEPYILANSVVCTVRVHVRNPISGELEFHDGVGAVPIQLEKGAEPLDTSKIIPTALQKNAPSAKSFAVSNAIAEYGKLFGRDLNNKDGLDYSWLLKEEIKVEDLEELYELKKEAMTPEDRIFAERILKEKEKASYNKLHNKMRSL
jgi:hypothetical protein